MIRPKALRAQAPESVPVDHWERVTAEALHARYLDDVFRYVSRRLARREEAEDVTADVFTAAFLALPRYHGKCSPYLWLLGIARRKIIDVRRRRNRRQETLVSEMSGRDQEMEADLGAAVAAAAGPEAQAMRAEMLRTIRGLVDDLKEEQREALLLQYVEGLPIADIAVVMARSPAAVNSLLQRARRTLFQRGRTYFLDNEVTR